MPFLGKSPKAGNYILLDSITTSATATYNLTRNSTAYFPASARNLIVSLNGITQAPDTAYSVSGSTITFSSALTSSDVIDYILVLGDVLSIGTPADNTVGESQLSYPLTNFSSTGIDDNAVATALTIKTHSGGTGATVGIGSTNPTAYSGTSALHVGDESGESELYMLGQYQTLIQMQADGAATSGTKGKHILYLFNDGSNNITVDNRLYSPRTSSGGYNTYKYYLDASTGTSDYAAFYTNGFERLRIDGSGNVGIGTDNPADPLHVRSTSGAFGATASFDNTSTATNAYAEIHITNDASENIVLGSIGSNYNNGDWSGAAYVYSTGSNRKLYLKSQDDMVLFTGGTTAASHRRLMITATGDVGINQMSPDKKLHVGGSMMAGSGSSVGGSEVLVARYSDGTDDQPNILGTSRSSSAWYICYGLRPSTSTADTFTSSVDNSTWYRGAFRVGGDYAAFRSNGGSPVNTAVGTTIATNEYVRMDHMGISFNGDTATANHLNDYEEGTWTPSVSTASSTTVHHASYTKTGRVVNFNIYITWSNNQNNNGSQFVINGLPFTCVAGSGYHGFSMGYVGSANMNDVMPLCQQNNTYIYMHQNDGSSAVIYNSDVYSRGLTTIIITGHYITDQ